MGNIGTAMSQTIPLVGAFGTQYATDINAFLTEVQARLTALVPRSSLAAGAFNLANNPLQNASYLGIQTGSGTPTTPAGTLQSFAGNLYWVTNTGAAQITSGNAINAASVGAITGDYGGANPAQFKFVAADLEYYAYTNFSGGTWAKLWSNGLDVAAGATSANRARILYGGAGSYSMTLPTALPSATKVLQMTTSGQIIATGQMTAQRNILVSGTGCRFSAGSASINTGQANTTVAINSTIYFPLVFSVTEQEALSAYTVYDTGTATISIVNTLASFAFNVPTQTSAACTGSLGLKTGTITTPAVSTGNTHDSAWFLKVVTGAGSTFEIASVILTFTVS